MKSIELSLLAIAALLAGGCMSVQLYDGPKRDRDEVARITGDPVVTAGSPVTVILRQVDGHDIGVTQTSVEVLEGKHNLLVDCRIAETKGGSRHSLDVEVYGGRKYRLRAETGPALRECTGVTLESQD
ncbi:hypothetical protein GCM10011487_32660 [Steroidobacter agaridevorans]|uniref:Lipoprotein n=1 Tax=Steroidobacter agaridevorans TaxID=2695856 RepID=A0A829YF98_9GAMM|nr:hypothetical protein [Steroidobacter agaridevorans]GFE81266.1 hypothetical protein GCM10011487_32660 [Steroidobacter agaridevorans]